MAEDRQTTKNPQDRTPLIDAIGQFAGSDPAFFRIPGHRFERGVDARALSLLGEKAYRADLTEAEGLDDLHAPRGPILTAEKLAADLYGSDRCWFLVNGTTCGNEAMILASVGPGEKILLPRNAHKSAMMGLILSGAEPVWLQPSVIPKWEISGKADPEEVRRALDQGPGIRAVFLVSPTYYGITSDLAAIADICHSHGVPLLVDEAHGSHLYFGEGFPKGAIASGADLAAQSIHKTIGSMTQSSMLQMRSELLDPARVDECLKLVMSTSPNYLLMASLDGARHLMAMHGTELCEKAQLLAELARDELAGIPGITVMRVPDADPLRVVFSAANAGITGYRLQELLFAEGRVSTELADFRNVVAVITWGNTADDIFRLVRTVRKVLAGKTAAPAAGTEAGDIFSPVHQPIEHPLPDLPPMAMTPREAFYVQKETVAFADAVGRIAGEAVIPYPPGIPILYPGEVVTGEIYQAARRYAAAGLSLHGPADPDLMTFQVVQEPQKRRTLE